MGTINPKPHVNILLIDDDEDDYLITKDMLSELGSKYFSLEWVDDYVTALQRIKEGQHDVYLVDYRLGGYNGLDLIKEAIAEGCTAPLILLTGLEDREVDIEAMKSGASDYLVKGQINAPLLERSIRYSIAHAQMLKALKEGEKRKEMFVATLTHDLQTPIRAEFRVLEQLKEARFGAITEEQQEVIDELIKSNRYKHHMVDNLLSTYKFEDVSHILCLEPTDINNLIRSCVKGDLSLLAEDRGHEISLQLANDLPELMLDPMEIQRVIYNLVQNAIVYTPPHGKITICTELRSPRVWVSVEDTGPGIEPEKMSLLFQPYSTAAKKLRQVGTGLGLYLSKQIIEAHGGYIGVDSMVGHGSRFFFNLPVQQADPGAQKLL